jgi:hypothetical protein
MVKRPNNESLSAWKSLKEILVLLRLYRIYSTKKPTKPMIVKASQTAIAILVSLSVHGPDEPELLCTITGVIGISNVFILLSFMYT